MSLLVEVASEFPANFGRDVGSNHNRLAFVRYTALGLDCRRVSLIQQREKGKRSGISRPVAPA